MTSPADTAGAADGMDDDGLRCPGCGEPAPRDANWCEACGHDLHLEPQPACVACGESQVGADGYCQVCGHRQPVGRDHLVEAIGGLAAVSDRGRRRHRNEDAFAIGLVPATDTVGASAVMVVCDGVATTSDSATASDAAAAAARDHLLVALEAGPASDQIQDVLRQAVASAQQATAGAAASAVAAWADGVDSAPSTTLVATVSRADGSATDLWVAWVGDSRAYLVGAEDTIELTSDHELAGALTRWLGADSDHWDPDVRYHRVEGQAWLLVCSDGLWRYLQEPMGRPGHQVVADIVAAVVSDDRETHLAEELIRFANDHGGHDNVTAAVTELNLGRSTTTAANRTPAHVAVDHSRAQNQDTDQAVGEEDQHHG